MKKSVFVIIIISLLSITACTNNTSAKKRPEHHSPTPVNVRDFGAVGDGQADDSRAFQAAVDTASPIHIPTGVYRLEKTVYVNLDKSGPASIIGNGTAKIIMAGPGPAFKIIGTHAGTASPASVKPNIWQKQRMPLIDGIEIVGDHPHACGLEITGTMKTTISRILIRKTLHAIRLTGTNRNLIISDCHIYENRGIGIFFDNVNLHQTNISNSHISYNPGGGIIVKGGAVYNLQIGNCDIEFNMDENSPSTANVLLDISKGGSIAEIAITGCTIQHTKNGIDSANIRTLGRENRTIEFLTVANNIFSDIDYNLHLKYTRGITVTGNVFFQGESRSMLIENCSSIAIGANVFDSNKTLRRRIGHGLVFRNCSDAVLTALQITDVNRSEAGLILENCRRFNISGCSFLNCENCGILMDGVYDSIITGTMIRNTPAAPNHASLILRKGSGNLITNNIFETKTQIAEGAAILENNH